MVCLLDAKSPLSNGDNGLFLMFVLGHFVARAHQRCVLFFTAIGGERA